MPTGPQCLTMRSNLIKDLLLGLKILSVVANVVTGAIEERKPQKSKPVKSKVKAKDPMVGKSSK